MNNEFSFKQYLGGISVSLAVLLLLIGVSSHQEIFTNTPAEIAQSFQKISTALIHRNQPSPNKNDNRQNIYSFNVQRPGDLIETENNNGSIALKHYRALYVPALVNDFEALPKLEVEVLNKGKKDWIEIPIYKTDRQNGLVYFLLKTEENGNSEYAQVFTGRARVRLIR